MLIKCPECNTQISDKAIQCPSCGCPREYFATEHTSKPIPTASKPKRKRKHPKLPNGMGSIKRLSCKKERYGVYPPVKKSEFSENGVPPTKTALCYVDDWYVGFYALMEYKNGTFDAEKLSTVKFDTHSAGSDNVISKIIESYNAKNRALENQLTFSEVYELFYKFKYVDSKKKYSNQSIKSTRAAFKNFNAIHNEIFRNLTTSDIQKVVDDCPLKHSSIDNMVSLIKQMYKYAEQNDIVDKDYGKFVKNNIEDDNEKGVPFSEEQINILWANKDDAVVRQILIMIYSGCRIVEFESIKINMEDKYFEGGVKTAAGKNRIIPMHKDIEDFISKTMYDKFSSSNFRIKCFYPKLEELGIAFAESGEKHTPHDTRHTFSWLCDKYKVDTISKHMIMGHSLGNDVEDSVYGHRTFEELRAEMNKIKVPAIR